MIVSCKHKHVCTMIRHTKKLLHTCVWFYTCAFGFAHVQNTYEQNIRLTIKIIQVHTKQWPHNKNIKNYLLIHYKTA